MKTTLLNYKLDDESERCLNRSWNDEIVLCKVEAGWWKQHSLNTSWMMKMSVH